MTLVQHAHRPTDTSVEARAMRLIRLLAEVAGRLEVQRLELVVRGDREGLDSARVLARVAEHVWGLPIDVGTMWCQGSAGIGEEDIERAEREGRSWRLVASATPGCAKVEPTKVPSESPLARNYRADVLQLTLVGGRTLTLHATNPATVAA